MSGPGIVDCLGTRGRAERIYSVLLQLQHSRLQLDAELLTTGKLDGDIISGPSGRTFAQERERLENEIARLADENAHLMPAIQSLVDRRDRDIADEEARLDAMTQEERLAERHPPPPPVPPTAPVNREQRRRAARKR